MEAEAIECATSTPIIGRREARQNERREAIVAAARRSFLDAGYAATSMSALLKTLGGSKATLWRYFRSKEELFAAVIEDITLAFRRQLEGELLAPAGLKPALAAFCRGFMSKTGNPDAVAAWRLVVAESGRFPEVGRIFYDSAAGHVERALARYVEEQISAGLLRDEGSASMAELLISMCAAQQNKLLWGVGSADDAGKEVDAEKFAEYFMRLFSTASAPTRFAGSSRGATPRIASSRSPALPEDPR